MRDGKLQLENPEDDKSTQLLYKKFILHNKLHLIKMQQVLTIPVYIIDVIYSKIHTAFLSFKR